MGNVYGVGSSEEGAWVSSEDPPPTVALAAAAVVVVVVSCIRVAAAAAVSANETERAGQACKDGCRLPEKKGNG